MTGAIARRRHRELAPDTTPEQTHDAATDSPPRPSATLPSGAVGCEPAVLLHEPALDLLRAGRDRRRVRVLKPNSFLSSFDIKTIFVNAAVALMLSVGMTYVIITAGIDLSVGSVLVFSGVVAAKMMIAVGGGAATATTPAGV